VSPTVERDDERNSPPNGRRHRQRRNEGVIALDVDNVPSARGDFTDDCGRKIIVAPLGPRRNAQKVYFVAAFLRCMAASWVRTQDRDRMAAPDELLSNFVSMRLDAAHKGVIARGDHKDAHAALVSGDAGSEYLIRQANTGDRDQVIRLISMMDYVTDGSARYDWLYASNPHGLAQSWIALERRTGRAVACTSFFPRKLLVDGVLRRGALGGDAYVEPQARRRGLAKALHRASFASFADGNVEFMYGPPYEDNLQALVKAGANFVGKLESCIRLLSLPKLHRLPAYYRSASRQLGKTLAQALADLPNMLLKPESTASDRAMPVTLPPVEHFDEEFDRIFEACAVKYRVVGLRDADYLNWRYLRRPVAGRSRSRLGPSTS
jgi:hypothetical protein